MKLRHCVVRRNRTDNRSRYLTPEVCMGILIASGIPAPVMEYQFHPTRKWRIDYAWPCHMLAVEIEGGVYGKGRECPLCKRREVGAHTSIQRLKGDMEKYNALTLSGWRLLRFTPEAFRNGTAVSVIKDFFDGERGATSKGY